MVGSWIIHCHKSGARISRGEIRERDKSWSGGCAELPGALSIKKIDSSSLFPLASIRIVFLKITLYRLRVLEDSEVAWNSGIHRAERFRGEENACISPHSCKRFARGRISYDNNIGGFCSRCTSVVSSFATQVNAYFIEITFTRLRNRHFTAKCFNLRQELVTFSICVH